MKNKESFMFNTIVREEGNKKYKELEQKRLQALLKKIKEGGENAEKSKQEYDTKSARIENRNRYRLGD